MIPDLGEVVAAQEDGLPLRLELLEDPVGARRHEGVEARGGLVQDQEIWLRSQGQYQPHLLPIPAAQVLDIQREVGPEHRPELFQKLPVHGPETVVVLDELLPGEVPVQRQVPGDVAYALPDLQGVTVMVHPEDRDAPLLNVEVV
jgi:hypothetical protein